MITIGEMNKLTILKIKGKKCFLDGEKYGEIFIRAKEVPEGSREGDRIEVFIYSSNDGFAATVKKPYATLNEFAYLKIVSETDIGLFLDWGIDKDLYLPKRYIQNNSDIKTYKGKGRKSPMLQEGDNIIIYVIKDTSSDGIIATTEIDKYIIREVAALEANDEVDLFVYKFTDLGANVIIDNKFKGIIYHNEIFSPLNKGDRIRGYIKKIRDDGKIDVSLVKQGFLESNIIAENKIIKTLTDNNGFLPIHDKSRPEEIRDIFHISKKSFKKASGTLYKKKIILIKDNGIKLLKTDKSSSFSE